MVIRKSLFVTAFIGLSLVILGGFTVLALHSRRSSAVDLLSAEPSGEYDVSPYVSPSYITQIGKPGVNQESYYLQPWRGYLETISAKDMLNGVGIVDAMTGTGYNADKSIQLLSYAGFKTARYEVEWGGSTDMNDKLTTVAKTKLQNAIQAYVKYGIRPIILLWPHQGGPSPFVGVIDTVTADAKAGDTSLVLSSVDNFKVRYTGASYLDGMGMMAGHEFTAIDPATKTVQLSKPLKKPITAGTKIQVHTLKYLPYYPVGTAEYEETASGWVKYVKEVTDTIAQSGMKDYDLEIWNEMSFGSAFTSINNYYGTPVYDAKQYPDFLHKGGQLWDIADRTAKYIAASAPGAHMIWGYSNTSAYHTADNLLPAGTEGETYHPYATGTNEFSPTSSAVYHPELFSYIPTTTQTLPESPSSTTAQQVESLTAKLRPEFRLDPANWPPGSNKPLRQMYTEHGFSFGAIPSIDPIAHPDQAQAYKAKFLLRSMAFLLNKGLSELYIFAARFEPNEAGFSVLSGSVTAADYAGKTIDQLMTPALSALRNYTQYFKDAAAISVADKRQLSITKLTSIGTQYKVFDGDATHPALYYRDRFAFLPYQVDAKTFIAGVYVMSQDATNPPPPMDFRVTIGNVHGTHAKLSLYDPLVGKDVDPANYVVEGRSANDITIRLNQVPDSPWLLKIQEDTDPAASDMALASHTAAALPSVCVKAPVAETSATKVQNVSVDLYRYKAGGIDGYRQGSISNVSTDSSGIVRVTDSAFLAFIQNSASYRAVIKPAGFLSQTVSQAANLLTGCITPPAAFTAGDFDGDDKVTLSDLIGAIGGFNGRTTPTAQLAAQTYGGKVSLHDLIRLIFTFNHPPVAATPTPTVRASATPVSTLAPTPSPTLAPTPSPSPTPTVPSPTPKPSPTPSPLATLHHVILTGQSLSVGQSGVPPLSTSQPYANLTLNSAKAFTPLVESGVETMASGLANSMSSWVGASYRSIVTNNGSSGQPYSTIKKGGSTGAYEKGIQQVKSAKAAADAAGLGYEVSAITVVHGETDGTRQNTHYEQDLVDWQHDYQTDVQAITGQTGTIPLFASQPSGSNTSTVFITAIEEVQAAKDHPDTLVLVGPKYLFNYHDIYHLTNTSYRQMGEYYGKVMKQVLIDKKPWQPLEPTSVTRSGAVITAQFHVPVAPLQIDTTLVKAIANYGFEFTDGSTAPPVIQSVTLSGTDSVKITLAAVPTGTDQHLKYAYTRPAGCPAISYGGADQACSLRGNLRDSDATSSLYGSNLANWAVHFDEPVK